MMLLRHLEIKLKVREPDTFVMATEPQIANVVSRNDPLLHISSYFPCTLLKDIREPGDEVKTHPCTIGLKKFLGYTVYTGSPRR